MSLTARRFHNDQADPELGVSEFRELRLSSSEVRTQTEVGEMEVEQAKKIADNALEPARTPSHRYYVEKNNAQQYAAQEASGDYTGHDDFLLDRC